MAATAATKIAVHTKLLFVGARQDEHFLFRLKGCLGTAGCAVILDCPSTFYELEQIRKLKNATAIISSNQSLLKKLVDSKTSSTTRKSPSIDNYAGSLFTIPKSTVECVFINPLEQLMTVPYGIFLCKRYISKLVKPQAWLPSTDFHWSIFDEATFQEKLSKFATAEAIAIDIETFQNPPAIRCVGYTALFYDGIAWTSESLVVPCDSLYNLACIRNLNRLPVPKIFQNGKYDIAYLQSYNAAPDCYYWDTAEFFHSWYSELPKDLASLNSFFVRNSMYWKDLASSGDLQQYYRYNALDTWATANVFLAWMHEAPQWARNNYANTFPLQYPCHLAEMTGIARDEVEMEIARAEIDAGIDAKRASLERMTATPGFNCNSPKQVMQLLTILGCKDLQSTEEKYLRKAALRHPINSRIINAIVGLPDTNEVESLGVRGLRKLKSTYLRIDSDATKQNPKGNKEFYGHLRQYHNTRRGRILYALNPHGTDTGRLASKEHHFWCGLQIQNIPRGAAVKRTLIADPGFAIAECDLEQAETRDTAYIAGETNLIEAVGGARDFHSVNASAFFGIPYDSIYDTKTRKRLLKNLIDIAKRVNHGANYLMEYETLINTMGEDKIWAANRLLKLGYRTLKDVASHLLMMFHKTYPLLKRVFYPGVIAQIKTTSMLVSKARHAAPYVAVPDHGYTRYCFGNPEKSKAALRSYVAHEPQSLNSQTLNKSFMRVFYDIALDKNHSRNFKLIAQVHDSIPFQYRIGYEYLKEEVKQRMEIPVTVKGYDGIVRAFTVPAAIKAGTKEKPALRWSEIE